MSGRGAWPRIVVSAANERVLRRGTALPPDPDGRPRDPYLEMGSHPDCVARVMEELAAVLPRDCRFLSDSGGVLAHPDTGTVFALPYGTAYAIRLAGEAHAAAVAAGLSPVRRWSDGATTDLTVEFGPGWLFGGWRDEEGAWLRASFDSLGSRGPEGERERPPS